MDQSATPVPSKQCIGPCGQVKPLTDFRPNATYRDGRSHKCRDCRNAADRARSAADPETARATARRKQQAHPEWRTDPETNRASCRAWAAAHPGASSARNRKHRAALRATVLAHYGQVCACCGSTKRLGIDHINGDGARHRRELFEGRGGARFYLWLIDQGFPEGYQTLCQPCNASKATGPRCRLDHTVAPYKTS